MQRFKTLSLWLFVATFGLWASAVQAAPDKDKDPAKKQRSAEAVAAAQAAAKGVCTPGVAFADLDVNNVRARTYNTGQLFYPDVVYEVPKGSGLQAIFAHGIWIGGQADGELRMAAATYAQFGADYEFFPGPLNADGTPPSPNDCSQYDRIWKVSREDVDAYNRGEPATTDLEEWPFELGAGVIDGDGNPSNYNLAGGDRPEIIGDQTLFWVMNDAAGTHLTTLTPPIGLEVRVTAFAFSTADALNNTTFYEYEMHYKPTDGRTLDNVFFGLWSDPDLGQYTDDFVGSDTTLGLGYVYNGDPFDETTAGYQDRPPALGYDFFQGPLVDAEGETFTDPDGTVHENATRLRMTRFVYYNNNNTDNGNPADADDFYGYLQGRWRDNSRMTFGGDGFGDDLGLGPTNFMFPGHPPGFWSEDNIDGRGTANTPADRRFLMSTGPFMMEPGDVQTIVFGVVWSQTANRHGSVNLLKSDDILAQGAFDFNFQLPRPPAAPRLQGSGLDETVVLSWNYLPSDNNYLNSYDEESAFLVDPDVDDQTFTFEGYKIYQYESPADFPNNGTVIATYDVVNGVTAIVQNAIDPETGAPVRVVGAAGSDSGVQNFIVLENDELTDQPLRNYTEYYFGVQAYAYNAFSDPPIYASPIAGDPAGGPLVVIPQQADPREGGTVLNADPADIVEASIGKLSDAIIFANVTDPLAITGQNYEVRFYEVTPQAGTDEAPSACDVAGISGPQLTYNIVRGGEIILNGEQYLRNAEAAGQCKLAPFGENAFIADGLSFTIVDAPAAFAGNGAGIVEVANQDGPLPPAAWDAAGAPYMGNASWWALNYAGSSDRWYVGDGNGAGLGTGGLGRYITFASPRDFEMRFTEEGGYGVYAFTDDKIARVPFELWDIGVGTPDDPSDDVRMIPFINNNAETVADWTQAGGADNFASGVDPHFGYPMSDWVYWMDPQPGSDGYEAFEAAALAAGGAGATYPSATDGSAEGYWANFYGGFVYPIGRMVIADYDGNGAPPPTGTVIRINTTKPIAAGDVFTVNTSEIAPSVGDVEVAENALDLISIVPNPYRGASNYDVSVFQDQVRITNLPEQATIRIYTLSGTLVQTLEKDSPSNFLRWDMRTEEGLPIASGIYLVHVETEFGEKVLKFGAVMKKIQLNVF